MKTGNPMLKSTKEKVLFLLFGLTNKIKGAARTIPFFLGMRRILS